MLRAERAVATHVSGWRRTPVGAAAGELVVGDSEREPAIGNVELDDVAVPHQRERPADVRLRRDVQHARAVRRPAHSRIGDADHVAHALFEQLLWNRQLAPFGHSGTANRTRVFEHEHRIARDRQGRVVDARRHVVVVCEHDRGPRMTMKGGLGGWRLDHGAVGREVAAQHGQRIGADERPLGRSDHVVVEHLRIPDVVAKRLPVCRQCLPIDRPVEGVEQRAQATGVEKVFHQIGA